MIGAYNPSRDLIDCACLASLLGRAVQHDASDGLSDQQADRSDQEDLAKKLEKAIKEIEEGRIDQAKKSIDNFIKDVEKAKQDKNDPMDEELADDFIEKAKKAKNELPEGKKMLRG